MLYKLAYFLNASSHILFPNVIGDSWWDEGEIPVFENRIKPICKDDGKLVFARLRVPAESKKNMLCSLKIMGITEATLFPDSLDKVCGGIVDRVVGESNAVRRMRGWKYH
ncbi:hypothetical protein [Slackia heliotrinireducens]|uniref:hypothetical protein n=1 Tax=Slackia heliotrinireducens TaxID=84110 RepID=UPI003315AE64